MSVCCSRLVKNVFTCAGMLDKEEPPISGRELNKRLRDEAEMWAQGDRRDFWGHLTQHVHPQIPSHIQQSLDNFNFEHVKPGLAIEFGCGNSILVSELLKKGWKVEAVDNSRQALAHLQQRIGQTVAEKMDNLTLVCADMETYQFPSDTRFIVAKDSLPYCNPDKIVEVWDKAYESLEDGGRIAGNFFPRPCNREVEAVQRGMMGAWFTDKAVVQSLLDKESYEVETCEYSKPRYRELFYKEPRQINFAGQKL